MSSSWPSLSRWIRWRIRKKLFGRNLIGSLILSFIPLALAAITPAMLAVVILLLGLDRGFLLAGSSWPGVWQPMQAGASCCLYLRIGWAMGLVFWVVGVPYAMLLTILSMLLSLVPFIGISLVAWPVGIILLIAGNTWQGILVIAAFLIIVANIDTALRPILVPKGAYLNPALIILSVFGGLGVMGIVGALYGPVVMILLVTSIEVYTKYMLRSDLEVLEEEGRVNLEELGLVAEEDQEGQGTQIFVKALKNISARFRPEPQDETQLGQTADSTIENVV